MKLCIGFLVSSLLVLVSCQNVQWTHPVSKFKKGPPTFANVETQIIGGSSANVGQVPWQASVQIFYATGSAFCGGSLIHQEWVLTAAHCVNGAVRFSIGLGSLYSSGSGGLIIAANQSYAHPAYVSGKVHHDIAIIKLSQPATLSSTVQIIGYKIPYSSLYWANIKKYFYVSGWGRTSDTATSISSTLNYVKLEEIWDYEAAQVYGWSTIIPSVICTKANGMSTCRGDSGGALVYRSSGINVQVGIVSFGAAASCQMYPSCFTQVLDYTQWIETYVSVLPAAPEVGNG